LASPTKQQAYRHTSCTKEDRQDHLYHRFKTRHISMPSSKEALKAFFDMESTHATQTCTRLHIGYVCGCAQKNSMLKCKERTKHEPNLEQACIAESGGILMWPPYHII
jgi:hypothetical protein